MGTESQGLARQEGFRDYPVIVHGDCPDFLGGRRDNEPVPFGGEADRHVYRFSWAERNEPVPVGERLLRGRPSFGRHAPD